MVRVYSYQKLHIEGILNRWILDARKLQVQDSNSYNALHFLIR